jgi:flagellar biosynthesis/type III secretory pathway chaperone
MQTPGNTCQRLVAALEILVAEEQCLVRSGEIQKIRDVQERTESIINRLAEIRRDPEVAPRETDSLLPRLAGLQARRASSIEMMGSRLAEMRATLAALDSARSRLGSLGKSYGSRRRANQPMMSRLRLSA